MTEPRTLPQSLAHRSPHSSLVIAIAVGVALVHVATLLQVTSPQGVIFGALTQLAFIAPGILAVRIALGAEAGWLPMVTFGPLLGMALSSVSLLGFWAIGVRHDAILLAAPLLASVFAWPARALRGRVAVSRATAADPIALLLLLLVVPLVVARAFSFVGADLPEGHVYRAYFTADYVWRRAVVAELAKGDFLPVNPFFAGDALHYYWLPHLLSAVEYRVAGTALGLDHLLMMRSVFIDTLFVTFLYGIARLFVTSSAAAAAGVACSILASSYEGLYAIWDHLRIGAPLDLIRYFNIDAVTRWLLGAMPIDGLHRMLLYQPHHAIGYSVGLIGLLIVVRRTKAVDPFVFAAAGALLGAGVLISSFGGLMITMMAVLHEGVGVLRRLAWRRALLHAVAAGVPLAVAAYVLDLMRYVDVGGQVIMVGLNPLSTHNLFIATALSFGPLLLVGGYGAAVALRQRRGDMAVFAAFTAVCIAFYFFVDIRDHQNVYVGWRVGHLMFIAGGTLMAVAFDRIGAMRPAARLAALAAAGIAIVAALPTVGIDLYNTQDVENRQMGPGFHWTLVLSHDEIDAFEWIQANTPDDAVFQVDPIARDSDTWAYLPAFAERRMAVGLPISMVPLDKYLRGSRELQELFQTEDPARAYAVAEKFGIRYLFIGAPERRAHPGIVQRLDAAPGLMPLLYRNNAVSIYAVLPSARADANRAPDRSPAP